MRLVSIRPVMKLFTFLLSVFLSFPVLVSGQPAKLSGVIPGGESAEIRLIVYADYVSYAQEMLGRTVVDEKGGFSFTQEIDETRMVTLEIGYYSISFFMEKSGEYVLYCDTIDLVGEFRPLYNKEPLPAYIRSEPEPGLNRLIGSFNAEYNDFIVKTFGGIYQKRNTRLISGFRDQQVAEYSGNENDYLDQYIAYKLAGVELAMAPAKKSELFNTYLKNQPVLYYHPEFMEFFNSFFDKHLYPGNRFVQRSDLYATINTRPDFHALIDTLGKDTLLRNEVLRELVCLKTLKELFYTKDFSRPQIIKVLQEFQQYSKFRHHREIAANLIRELTLLQKGTYPPTMELKDLFGTPFTLQSLQGKPVYIMFFATWSSGCLTELGLMKDLYERYSGKVNFVSISLDNNPEIVRKLVEEKGYTWNFMFNGMDYDLLNNYRIRTFPVFLLLDGEGRVVEYPAYKPSEIIHESFDKLLVPE